MTTVKAIPIKEHTQRQWLAKTGHVTDRTVRRWRAFCETHSLDWLRVCPDGRTTPRYLHPYQVWLLSEVITQSYLGEAWWGEMLLKDPKWGYEHWNQNHRDK